MNARDSDEPTVQDTDADANPQNLLSRASDLLCLANRLVSDIAALQAIHGLPNQQQKQQKSNQPKNELSQKPPVFKFTASKPPLVQGLAKLRNAVRAEIKFLEKLMLTPDAIRAAHVQCSNIPHLSAVLALVHSEPEVTHVYRVFSYAPDAVESNVSQNVSHRSQTVRVDVVAAHGTRWIKVKASSMRSAEYDLDEFDQDSDDDDESDSFGDDEADHSDTIAPGASISSTNAQSTILQGKKPAIVRQATMLLEAARQNPVHYTTPTVVMKFLGAYVPSAKILEMLISLGIVVEFGNAVDGQVPPTIDTMPTHENTNSTISDSIKPETKNTNHMKPPSNASASISHPPLTHTLNIDITTLITLVTDICHRFDEIPDQVYDVVHLQNQAESERRSRILPKLMQVLMGHDLITTRAAVDKFAQILDKMGGPVERARARALFDSKDLVGTLLDTSVSQKDENDDFVAHGDTSIPASSRMPSFGRIRVVENQPSDRFLALMTDRDCDSDVASKSSVAETDGDDCGSCTDNSDMGSVDGSVRSFKTSRSQLKSFQQRQKNHLRMLRTRLNQHNAHVFGTGDRLRVTTVTANAWIERSLAEMGLPDVSVYVHEPRSLVEMRFRRFMLSNDSQQNQKACGSDDAATAVAAEPHLLQRLSLQ